MKIWAKSCVFALLTAAVLTFAGCGSSGPSTTTTNKYSVGGTVTGLAGTGLVLLDNGGNSLPVSTSGSFTFSTSLASGSAYAVTVQTQPSSPAQLCTVSNGNGTVANANVTNVTVACTNKSIAGDWTWMGGSSTAGASGVYGTLGTPSATNIPMAHWSSVSWTDASGDFWLFGGFVGYDSVADPEYLNDLWEYSPQSGEWTWMGGSSTVGAFGPIGVYGTKGTPAVANIPGARWGAISWTDTSGNLWLFGGNGSDSTGSQGDQNLNDLWEYSPKSGQWAWMNGSLTANASGVYGTEDTPAATNSPGARQFSVSWTDASGNLWLFGGYGSDSTGAVGFLNDLWEYNLKTGEWAWMNGSSTDNALQGVYGTQGTPAATNVPGARHSAASWTDSSGNLWLFGGAGYDTFLNDLWEYSPQSDEWTWMGGSSTGGASSGVYGTQGTPAVTNVPGGRHQSVSWTDASGNLWLFGGYGYAATGNPDAGELNDLWEYSPKIGEWAWIGGSSTANATGIYGAEGMPDVTNNPGARYGAVSWTDASGNLWLFGGSNNGWSIFNDLWEYQP